MDQSQAPTPKPTFTRKHYAWLAAGFLALLVYGSLVPFQVRPVALGEALERYRQALAFVGFRSRTDLLANILLGVPIGYLLLGALAVDRDRWFGLLIAPLVLLFCVCTSGLVEFAQIFFPPRNPDIDDIMAQTMGACLGMSCWLGFGQQATGWLRAVWSAHVGHGLAGLLLPGYLIFVAIVHVLPLDLTLSPAELYHKYREGRVLIVPFRTAGDAYEVTTKHLKTVAYFLPVGVLLAYLPNPTWRSRRGALKVFGLGLLFASGVAFLKLFVNSRFFDSTDMITGSLAVVAGWGIGLFWRSASGSAGGLAWPSARWCALLSLGWLAILILVQWQPFDFTDEGDLAQRRWQSISWLPLADFQDQSYITSLEQIVKKTLLFIPLGFLLTFALRSVDRKWQLVLVLALTTVTAMVLEAGKLFLPARTPSVTALFFELAGAAIGWLLARRVHALT